MTERLRLPLDEDSGDKHPAQAGLFDSRSQKVKRYLTYTWGLKLPEVDDNNVPAAALLAPDLGMAVRVISESMVILRREGVLPPAQPENTRKRASISSSFVRGNKWPVMQRYAPFMYPAEVLSALIEQLGEEEVERRGLDRDSIARIITKHGLTKYKSSQLKDLSPEQRQATLNFTHEPDEKKKGRVKFWSAVMDLLDKQGIEHPSDREVWMDIWQRAKTPVEGVAIILHPDPLTTPGSMVKLTGEYTGLVEGEAIEDCICYVKIRLLTGPAELKFGDQVFKYIPKALMGKRAELILPEKNEPN